MQTQLRFARLAAVALALAPGLALAKDAAVDGSLRLRLLHSRDSGENPTVTFGFFDTDVRARELTDAGLSLRLDATFLYDVSEANERRYGPTETFDQVRQLHARQPFLDEKLTLSVGRQLLWEAGNAWVDGATVEYRVDGERLGVGVYGGLAPDVFDYSLDTGAQATGVYAAFTGDATDAALAYSAILDAGSLNRHFLYQRAHHRLFPGLYVADYLVVDFANEVEITTLLASVDYTPVPAVNLTLNVSRYSIEQYRDASVYHNVPDPNQTLVLGDEIVDLVYNRARFSVSLRFLEHLYHYQAIEAKHRSQDDREAYTYTIGLRDEDLAGTDLRADLSVQLHNGYQSDSELISLTLERDLGAMLNVEAHGTLYNGRTVGRATERGRLFDEAQEIYLFGFGLSGRPGRHHEVSATYDGIYEAELQDLRNHEALFIHTVMGRYVYSF